MNARAIEVECKKKDYDDFYAKVLSGEETVFLVTQPNGKKAILNREEYTKLIYELKMNAIREQG
jgi:hypothetical protein